MEFKNKGILLKLHGSFNWLVCKNRKCEMYNKIKPPFQARRYKLLRLRECWSCSCCGNNKLEPQIVPPVSNKLIHKNSFLKNQWLLAREKLLEVDELVFIGYSFPPTDFYTEWLFRQLNFFEEPKKLNIVVVNPEYGKRNSLVTKRYNRIFKSHDIKSYKTLKDYSKDVFG